MNQFKQTNLFQVINLFQAISQLHRLFVFELISMGNRQSILRDIQFYKPPNQDLVLKDAGYQFRIYQHKFRKYELMANKVTLHEQRQLPILVQNFKARYQHHYLVSTIYLACQDYSTCGGYFEAIIFYERLFTNLSKIKDIPFPDVLHLYAVAFKGFQIIYQRFGYFEIYEDMFHLSQDSKLKVWCNKDVSKNQPQSYLLDKNGSEQDMIRKIIFIVGQNTDVYTDRINVRNRLLTYGVRNFEMANQSLRQICRQFNLSVPERVQCMTSLPSEDVQVKLDLYASVKKLPQAQDLKTNSSTPTSYPNNQMLSTPYFNTSQVPHAPIDRQFFSHQQKQNIPNLNLSTIQNNRSKQRSNNMIHTFNKKPQTFSIHSNRGINLILGNTQKNEANHIPLDIRNKSLSSKHVRNQIGYNNRSNSLQRRRQIKVNFGNQSKPVRANRNQNLNTPQRAGKMQQPQISNSQHFIAQPRNQVRNNSPFQPIELKKIPQSISRVNYVPHMQQRYDSQPDLNPTRILGRKYSPPIQIHALKAYNTQTSSRIPKKGNVNAKYLNQNVQKSVSFNNNQTAPYHQPSPHQTSKKKSSIRHNKDTVEIPQSYKNEISQFVNYPSKQQQHSSITKKVSAPISYNNVQYSYPKVKQSPFQTIEKKQNQKNNPYLNLTGNYLNRQVLFDKGYSQQFNLQDVSSRYLYSSKQLNDNIPDLKYKNKFSSKNIDQLFDTKIQELQSFNQSKYEAQNCVKQQNSQVLQIIGRQEKDSLTSAFRDQQILGRYDEIKQFTSNQNSKDYLKLQNPYRGGNSFTDPKILEMLRKPSSNALKRQIIDFPMPSKQIQYSAQVVERLSVDREVKQDTFKLDNGWQFRQKEQNYNLKRNLIHFKGFPPYSEYSEINTNAQDSFSDQKEKYNLSNNTNLNRKMNFYEQKNVKKKQENNPSQLSQYDYQSPTYGYSFQSKRQVPMQDNEWKAQYRVTGPSKDEFITTLNRQSYFGVVPQKPVNNLMNYNGNETSASPQFQLTKKRNINNMKDNLKGPGNQPDFNLPIPNLNNKFSDTNNRNYNPKIDPQINHDLQRFRKLKQQLKHK